MWSTVLLNLVVAAPSGFDAAVLPSERYNRRSAYEKDNPWIDDPRMEGHAAARSNGVYL